MIKRFIDKEDYHYQPVSQEETQTHSHSNIRTAGYRHVHRLYARLAQYYHSLSSTQRTLLLIILTPCLLFSLFWCLFSHCSILPPLALPSFLSFTSSSSSNTSPLPWMDEREIHLINQYLDSTHHMLEFGSGESSFYFSRRVKSYTSIEHDRDFCTLLTHRAQQPTHSLPYSVRIIQIDINKTSSSSSSTGRKQDEDGEEAVLMLYDNQQSSAQRSLTIYCVSPSTLSPSPSSASLWTLCYCCFVRCPSTLSHYKDYVHMPEWLSLASQQELASPAPPLYDRVLIDGRARPQTAYYTIPYSHTDTARFFLHDWNQRPAYHVVLQWFDIVDAQYESTQPGGGGLVVLKVKEGITGKQVETELAHVTEWWW